MPKNRLNELKASQSDQVEEDFTIETQEIINLALENIFQNVEGIRCLLNELDFHVKKVKSKYGEAITSPQPHKNWKQELDDLMDAVLKTAIKAKTTLESFEQNFVENSKNKFNAEYRIQKVQHSALTEKFFEIMSHYSTIQTNYRDKCKENMKRQLKISGKNLGDEDLEEMLKTGDVAVLTEAIIFDSRDAKLELAEIEKCLTDIVGLEKSIKDLSDLYTNLALLSDCSNQGAMIDNIERNVEGTIEFVEVEEKEPEVQVEQNPCTVPKKKVYTALLLCAFLIFILIMFYYFGRRKSHSIPPKFLWKADIHNWLKGFIF